MLEELKATAFEHQITFESRTQPWIVLAGKDKEAPQPYVVKIFSKNEVEDNYAVAKEVFANVIAKAFELSVPEPALIDLNTDFLDTLSPGQSNLLFSKDYRLKFGTKYIEGSLPFNKNLPDSYYDTFPDTDSIFAFDNFILNMDRNTGKPDNFRLLGESYLLIDHEHSLAVTKEIMESFAESKWIYPFVNHIFYYYLLLKRDKADYFNHFTNRLALFEPDILDSYNQQLREHQFDPPYGDYDSLKLYLNQIKTRSQTFVHLLESIFGK